MQCSINHCLIVCVYIVQLRLERYRYISIANYIGGTRVMLYVLYQLIIGEVAA